MMATSTPQTALKSQRKLTKEQAEGLQAQWVAATTNRRGAPPVLPPDIDFQTIGLSPADLLLLDVQTFSAQVIASAYGVPSSLLNMPIEGGLNYQTPILLLEQWWRSELRPAAKRISSALSAQMLPAGSYVEFDAREFLAPSFKELAETFALLSEKGIVTVEQAATAVLHLSGETVEQLATPPSAGASPAQSPNGISKLRPTTAGV
jgi:HK97 family phage portal protein